MTARTDRRARLGEYQSEWEIYGDFRNDELSAVVGELLDEERDGVGPSLRTFEGTHARLDALLAQARALPVPSSEVSGEWEPLEGAWRAHKDVLLALAGVASTHALLVGKRHCLTPWTDGFTAAMTLKEFVDGPLWRKVGPLLWEKARGKRPPTRSLEGWVARLEALLPICSPDEAVTFAAVATHGFLERDVAAGRVESAIDDRRREEEERAWEDQLRLHPPRPHRFRGLLFDALLARDVQ